MKRIHNWIIGHNRHLIIGFIAICGLFLNTSVVHSQPEVTATEDVCNASFTVRLPIWETKCSGNDNELENANIYYKIGSNSRVRIRSAQKSTSSGYRWGGSQLNGDNCWDSNEFIQVNNYPGWSASLVEEDFDPARSWVTVDVTFSDIWASWWGQSIQIEIIINFDTDSDAINTVKTISFPTVPSPSIASVSQNEYCDSIAINWTKPSLQCSDSDYRYNIRWRDSGGDFSSWRNVPGNANNTTYFHTNLGLGSNFDYEVRTQFLEGSQPRSVSSSVLSGTTKTLPSPPDNLNATTTNCTSTVELNWSQIFSEAIDSIEISRDNTSLVTITGNQTSYSDTNNISKGVFYDYRVRALNKCGWGAFSTATTGLSPLDPSTPANLNVIETADQKILVTWDDSDYETEYILKRLRTNCAECTYLEIPRNQNETSYLDDNFDICEEYEYTIFAVNDCVPDGVPGIIEEYISVEPDLSMTFDSTSLRASKGFYSDKVELRWNFADNDDLIENIQIYRIQLGTDDTVTVESNLSASEYEYTDNTVLAGVLYEYLIKGNTDCTTTGTLYSNYSKSIGFRAPFGIISGQVTYGSGIAVEGVRIGASTNSQINGKSIRINLDDSLIITDHEKLNLNNEL